MVSKKLRLTVGLGRSTASLTAEDCRSPLRSVSGYAPTGPRRF